MRYTPLFPDISCFIPSIEDKSAEYVFVSLFTLLVQNLNINFLSFIAGKCKPKQFLCKSGYGCLDSILVCDDKASCLDNSDEEDCGTDDKQ